MPYMMGNVMCRNDKRFAEILKPGDKIEALGHTGINSGLSAEFEIRAVHHWGVFAKMLPNPYHSRPEIYMKKRWKIKWNNIFQYHLL